jgi:hypothetical protein
MKRENSRFKRTARKDTGAVQTLSREIDLLTAQYSETLDRIRAASPKYAALDAARTIEAR